MSDVTGAIVALIALKQSGLADRFIPDKKMTTGWEILSDPVSVNGKPPTSEAGVRPHCAVGQKAKFNSTTDSWECVPSGWD